MRYTKKGQKQKKSHLISSELVSAHRFEEVVKIADGKSDLTNRDRYLYGYSLLRIGHKVESLVNLWPLVAKGYIKLQEDCASLAAHIFRDENFLSSAPLSEDTLCILFFSARALAPKSPACRILKRRLFEALWEKRSYEKLEHILKSSKEDFSDSLLENLSKLTFFQAEKKLIGNPQAFVSYVLTGAACLIARNPVYHHDIADELQLLANELKHLFSQLKVKRQITFNQVAFESFVDYEVNILNRVLQLAVEKMGSNLGIIPTPGYLITYDSSNRLTQKFLGWLSGENKTLFEMYRSDIHHIVLWLLSGEKTHYVKNILQSIHKYNFDPYLRLAILLRSVNNKKSFLRELVQVSDFKEPNEDKNLFKSVVLQTIKCMISAEPTIPLSPEFLEILQAFSPVLQAPEINNFLIKKAIISLRKEHEELEILNLNKIMELAHQLNVDELKKQISVLCDRQRLCSQFLLNLEDKKKAANSLKHIKNASTLSTHLTLISDACYLIYPKLSLNFFMHIQTLVENKKINKYIPLKERFAWGFECYCFDCQMELYRQVIPSVSRALNLPIVSLPDVHQSYLPVSQPPILKPLDLSKLDPFKILGVSLVDPKQTIIQKVMQLIQRFPEKMAVFRQAQSELFNPAQRFLYHYFYYLAYEDSDESEALQLTQPTSHSLQDIPLRHEFLYENA